MNKIACVLLLSYITTTCAAASSAVQQQRAQQLGQSHQQIQTMTARVQEANQQQKQKLQEKLNAITQDDANMTKAPIDATTYPNTPPPATDNAPTSNDQNIDDVTAFPQDNGKEQDNGGWNYGF